MRKVNRIDNPKTIDKNFVESEIKLGKIVIIQFVTDIRRNLTTEYTGGVAAIRLASQAKELWLRFAKR